MNIQNKNFVVIKTYSAKIDIYDKEINYPFTEKQINLFETIDVLHESFNFNIRRFLRDTLETPKTEEEHYNYVLNEINQYIDKRKFHNEEQGAKEIGFQDKRFKDFIHSIMLEIKK